jgi:Cu2+-containing amine oxidase
LDLSPLIISIRKDTIMAAVPHPFDPITPGEIHLATRILEAAFPKVPLRYKKIDVQEPIKKEVVPFIEAERLGKPLPPRPTRLLQVLFHRMDTGAFYKALLNAGKRSVVYAKELPKEIQGPVDPDELIEIEQLCLNHPAVKAEVAKMQLPKGVTVCNDPWIYGTDDPKETRRLFQCYMYVVTTDHPQNNHYSVPCKFSPVFDGLTRELVRMDYLPGGPDAQTTETQPWKPVETIQYAHDLLGEPLRTDLKPYIVQQPEGPSFNLQGNVVSWQKWRFHVGFNSREGLVIYNVTYDNRNLFYRLSVSEMTVPYGGMSLFTPALPLQCTARTELISPQIPAHPTIVSKPSMLVTLDSASQRTNCRWDVIASAISSISMDIGPIPKALQCTSRTSSACTNRTMVFSTSTRTTAPAPRLLSATANSSCR